MQLRYDVPPGQIETSLAPPVAPAAPRRRALRSAVTVTVTLAALWTGLHWDDPESWVVGAPAAVLGGASTLLLPAPEGPRVSPLGGLRFTAFAAYGVLRGAWDVSLRSLRPGDLTPGTLTYITRLPEGAPRRVFALSITMLPGTLTTHLNGAEVDVHVLDPDATVLSDLRALETHVAALFALPSEGASL